MLEIIYERYTSTITIDDYGLKHRFVLLENLSSKLLHLRSELMAWNVRMYNYILIGWSGISD